MTARTTALASALLALACAPRIDPRLVAQPIAPAPARTWLSPLHRDHPLAGRIWDPRANGFVAEPALEAAARSAHFLLLGETHDNADHHVLQARLVRAATAGGRRPALAFEMLDTGQQAAVDAALARSPGDPDAIAKAAGWKESRWPAFALYRPIFAAGLDAGLPVVAANLPRPAVRAAVKDGAGALDEPLRARLARDEPLPEALLEGMREEMRESHCNELPELLIDPLVLAQRARDARMAERLLSTGRERGAILVAGKGHVRTDRGVPALLAADAPELRTVAVAFVEVDPEVADPAGYVEEWGPGPAPFDLVVFTPRAEREDPCEALRLRRR